MCITIIQLSSMNLPLRPLTNPERLARLETMVENDDSNINVLRDHLDTTIHDIKIMFSEVYKRLHALETGVHLAPVHNNPIRLELTPGLNPAGANRTDNANPFSA
jgi:hypothetical protein